MKTSWSKLTVALGAAFAVTACTAEIPEHKHPEPVFPQPEEKLAAKVESFVVEPGVIQKGAKATITWKVTNATSISIKDSDGKGVEGVAADALTGTVEVQPEETTGYILSAIGEGGNDFGITELRVSPEQIVIPEAPLLFAAVPTEIKAGQEAHLVWNGPGPVSITYPDGTPIDTQGRKSGSVRLPDLLKTTEFTARSGNQESKATITVKPAIGTFVATPAGASAGQPIRLSWTTGGAETVKISERSRGEIHEAAANERAEGFFEDTIPAGLANGTVLVYTLTASNDSGIETRNLQLTVSVTPTITEFKLDKAVLTVGGTTKPKLSWRTSNAARVSIYTAAQGQPTNSLLFKAPSSSVASNGSVDVDLPTVSTDYELVAEAEQGGQTRQTITLELVDPPVIANFGATPQSLPNGGAEATLSWNTSGGNLLVITTQDGSAVASSRSQGFINVGSQTVNPGSTATYTLKLTNKAGDFVTEEATVNVDQPLVLTVNPPIAVIGEDVQISWNFGSIATNVVGAPSSPETEGFDSFIDISDVDLNPTRVELLAPTSTGSTSKTIEFPDSFKFRYYGIQYDKLFVSSHGWVGFGSQSSATAPSAIGATATPNNFIAPFAFTQGFGKVYWDLQGTAPNRKLIVQWHGMKTATGDGSNYNYEVIFGEDGHIDFLYDIMDKGSPTTENNKYVGLENLNGSEGITATLHGTDPKSIPNPGTHMVFFGPAAPDGSATVKATGSATYEIRLALTNGGFTRATGIIGVPSVGDVKITEVMFKPSAGAPDGAWVELHNLANYTIDSGDLSLKTAAGTVQLPSAASGDGALIAPGEYKVVGLTKDRGTNGDTPVDIVAPFVLSDTADTIEVLFRGALSMNTASFSDGGTHPAGASLVLTGFACASVTPYGLASHFGSPGSAGTDVCGYSVAPIPANYHDIFTTGTVFMNNDFWNRRKLVFPAGFTFPFEGQDRTEVMVGNGYLNFDTTLSDTASDPQSDVPSAFPSTGTGYAGGVIAIFWDANGSSTLDDKWLHQYFDPDNDPATKDGYLIIQFSHQDFSGTTPDADLNYQIWLYENGNIDFQYGTMKGTTGTSIANREKGANAAVGISNVAGTAGLVYSYKQPLIQENTGLRFTKH